MTPLKTLPFLKVKILKSFLPYFIMLLCCVLYSLNYSNRFIWPEIDETLNAVGKYKHYVNYGPLYSFYYSIITHFTHDIFLSVKINFYLITFWLLPWATFLALKMLGMDLTGSCLVSLLTMISFWNFRLDPKVQLFHWILILLIISARATKSRYKDTFFYLSYAFFTLALFVRQDTLLVFLGVILFDFFNTPKKKKIFFALTVSVLIFGIASMIIANPYGGSRSLDIVLDHIWSNNPGFFTGDPTLFYPRPLSVDRYFNFPHSPIQVFFNKPFYILEHIRQNFKVNSNSLLYLFSFDTANNWRFPNMVRFYLVIALLGAIAFSKIEIEKENLKFFKWLSFLIVIKCLAVSLLLSLWLRYFLEIHFLILFFLTYFLGSKLKSVNGSKILSIAMILFPFIFYFYNYSPVNTQKRFLDIDKKLETVLTNRKKPVILTSRQFSEQFDSKTKHDVNYFTISDSEKNTDFTTILNNKAIDIIIMHPQYKISLEHYGLSNSYKVFEENAEKFGYKQIYTNADKQIIYQKMVSE